MNTINTDKSDFLNSVLKLIIVWLLNSLHEYENGYATK